MMFSKSIFKLDSIPNGNCRVHITYDGNTIIKVDMFSYGKVAISVYTSGITGKMIVKYFHNIYNYATTIKQVRKFMEEFIGDYNTSLNYVYKNYEFYLDYNEEQNLRDKAHEYLNNNLTVSK